MKHCKRCDTIKPRAAFNTTRGKASGLLAHCRDCTKEQWHASPEENRFRARAARFGITYTEYMQLRAAQNDCCAICGEPESDVRLGKTLTLAIDHCHATEQRRGLLCGRCNKALGMMADDPARLRAAADYVERWAAALAIIR